jgi:hypothetical protein
MKFDFRVSFENLLRKFKVALNLTRITGTLHEDKYTFWSYLAHFFLKFEVFQIQVVEKIKRMKRVKPTRCYSVVYWTLRFAQPVSGIIMPIIRSLWLYRWPQRVAPHLGYGRLLVWCMAVGLSVQLEGSCTTRGFERPVRGMLHDSWTSRATSL